MLDSLMDPPFAQNPAFRANAKIVGIVLAILAGIGLLFGLLGFVVALGLLATAPFFALGLIVQIVGDALCVYGGYLMYKEDPVGKRWVIYGLVAFLVSLVLAILGGSVGAQIIPLVVLAAVYYIVVTSRFPSEGSAPART